MGSQNKQTILIVEDETTIREVLRRYLEREGFRVQEAGDGYQALDSMAADPPDLILLDLMLPGVDGLTITRNLRQNSEDDRKNIPIARITDQFLGAIRGLDFGADDYIAKPFSPREVVSRVHAVLRRSGTPTTQTGEVLRYSGLMIDTGAHSVEILEKPVSLSAKEFDLLLFFIRRDEIDIYDRTAPR